MDVGRRVSPWGFGHRAGLLRGRGYARPRIVRPAPARRQGLGAVRPRARLQTPRSRAREPLRSAFDNRPARL